MESKPKIPEKKGQVRRSEEELWRKYHEEHKSLTTKVVEPASYVENKDCALDIGAGSMNAVKYLIKEGGFKKVVAIDPFSDFEKFTKGLEEEIGTKKLVTQNIKAEDFHFEPNTYDFIYAAGSLPYVPEKYFLSLWQKIYESLKRGGIFSGNLLERDNTQEKDNYFANNRMTFPKDELDWLFEQYEVISLKRVGPSIVFIIKKK